MLMVVQRVVSLSISIVSRPALILSVVHHSGHFDFDPGGGWRERCNLHQGAGGTASAKCLPVRAGNGGDIRHVDNINHGSHDVAQVRSRLAKCRNHRLDCASHLLVRIPIKVRRACCRSRDEYLVSDADGTRIAVCVLERIAG